MPLFRLFVISAAVLLAGCAAKGPQYQQVEASLPTLRPGYGRLVIYRPGGLGPGAQPNIVLNGEIVGKSQSQAFFFADRTAGRYMLSARTEVEATLEVELVEGRTSYVQTSISAGVFVGHPQLTLQSEDVALQQLPRLAYVGGIPLLPGAPRAGVANNTTARSTSDRSRTPGPVTLDDLSGLLPPAR